MNCEHCGRESIQSKCGHCRELERRIRKDVSLAWQILKHVQNEPLQLGEPVGAGSRMLSEDLPGSY